jgi:hypothetical protein
VYYKTDKMKLRDTTEQEREVLEWLNDVRERSIIDMFTVVATIEVMHKVSNCEAKRLLALWVRNYNDGGAYEDVIKECA